MNSSKANKKDSRRIVQLALEQHSSNWAGPLIRRFFSIDVYTYGNDKQEYCTCDT